VLKGISVVYKSQTLKPVSVILNMLIKLLSAATKVGECNKHLSSQNV
jgi:hypothetical protein